MAITPKYLRKYRRPDPYYPDSKEGILMKQCEALARDGRLRLDGYGSVRIRGRQFRARIDSRLFRAAVEVLTRQRSGIIRISVDRRGRPVDVVLYCPNCNRRRNFGIYSDPPQFALETWRPRDSRAEALGSCTGCWAMVELYLEPDLTWRAKVDRKELPEERA